MSAPPSGSLRRVRNIATVVGCVATLALALLWWRSYSTADRIEGWLWGGNALIVTSKQGCVGAIKFPWTGPVDEWGWRVVSPPTDEPDSFPAHPVDGYTNRAGFGRLDYGNYIISSPAQSSGGSVVFDGKWIVGGQAYFLSGKGYIVPYWFLLFASAIATALTRWSGRLTVRGMLILTAFVAVLVVVFKLWVFGDAERPMVP